MNWAGFSGSQKELKRWRKRLRDWSVKVSKHRRRPELVEDIESLALEILVEREAVGQEPDASIEREVAKRLELTDSFNTARDGDLGARFENFKGHSFIEEFIPAHQGKNEEDRVIAALDREPVEEGKDQAELQSEIARESADLFSIEEQVLSLHHIFHFRQVDTARYLNCSQGKVSRIERRTKQRLRGRKDLKEYNEAAEADPNFTLLEIKWITL
jgi:hypothetical protein